MSHAADELTDGNLRGVNNFKLPLFSDISGEDADFSYVSNDALEQDLNQFKDGNFVSAYDCIENWSHKTVLQHEKDEVGAVQGDKMFDFSDFEAVFKKEFSCLSKLHSHNNKKLLELSKDCAAMEDTFKKKIDGLSVKSDLIFKNFSDYDSLISKIANSVRVISANLEDIESKRCKAIETRIYIYYISELNKVNVNFDRIFKNIDNLGKAILIKNLTTLSDEMSNEQSSIMRTNIEKAAESLECEVLDQFANATEENNYDVMKESSRVLFELNNGEECIKYYINRMSIFFENEDFAEEYESNSVSPESSAMQTTINYVTVVIDNFYERILNVIKNEAVMIFKVFPTPSIVLQKLVRRLFEQTIFSFLEALLHKFSNNLDLKLKTFYHAFKQAKTLAKTISEPPILISIDMLSFLINSVFERSREEYIDMELRSMREFYEKEKRELLDFKSNEPSSVVSNTQNFLFELPVDMTVRCIERGEEASERCAVLSNANSLAWNIYSTFKVMKKEFGEEILLKYLIQATKHLSLNSNLSVIEKYFLLIQTINTNAVLLHKHFFIRTRPHVEGHKKEQALYQEESNKLFVSLEQNISSGLEKVLKCQLSLIQVTLTNLQKKSDYRPKSTDMTIDLKYPTKACDTVCKYIRASYNNVKNCLDGRNIQTYMYAFGMKFLSLLLKHIKKFYIESGVGGMCFMRDVTEYQECINSFAIPSLDHEFQVLSHIVKLYIVDPEKINEVVSLSPQLSKLSKSELESFIKIRNN